MRHFFRCHMPPADVLAAADDFFPHLELAQQTTAPRARTFSGPLGALKLSARAEGGHYTFVQVETDQMGESRLDRNVKRFFDTLHRREEPAHAVHASY